VTVSFQSTPDGQFLGFMNTSSYEPLSGISTLLEVHQNPTGFVPEGVGIGTGDQLLVTADSIQVLDLQVVCALLFVHVTPFSLTPSRVQKDNLDDGDHPFHLHGHRPWMYV
jgi:iron transport multicopper oxidase